MQDLDHQQYDVLITVLKRGRFSGVQDPEEPTFLGVLTIYKFLTMVFL